MRQFLQLEATKEILRGIMSISNTIRQLDWKLYTAHTNHANDTHKNDLLLTNTVNQGHNTCVELTKYTIFPHFRILCVPTQIYPCYYSSHLRLVYVSEIKQRIMIDVLVTHTQTELMLCFVVFSDDITWKVVIEMTVMEQTWWKLSQTRAELISDRPSSRLCVWKQETPLSNLGWVHGTGSPHFSICDRGTAAGTHLYQAQARGQHTRVAL